MTEEEFRVIPGYSSYSISNQGKLRNNKTGKILKTFMSGGANRDYVYCRIINEDGYKKIGIHRLMALTFISNPNNLPIVDHIDRNTINNTLSNLRWATHSTNVYNRKPVVTPLKTNSLNELYIMKQGNKFKLVIKGLYLGLYQNLDDAVKIRDFFLSVE